MTPAAPRTVAVDGDQVGAACLQGSGAEYYCRASRPPWRRWHGGVLLQPFAWVYGLAATLNRRRRACRARKLPCPVVSIGNITCGGTGKTPTVEMVVRDLLRLGRRPCIISRGYGGRFPPAPGGGEDVPRRSGNDEFHVLAANVADVPHLQGSDRYNLGLAALRDNADVVVLDDGFQHVALHRDLDMLLIDALAPFRGGRVLPAGLLREPLKAIEHADLIAVTRSDQVAPRTLATLVSYLQSRFPSIPLVQMRTRPVEWRTLAGESSAPGALAGRRALLFCGIGNPRAFVRQVADVDVQVARTLCFPDHHRYTDQDLKRIAAEAAQARVNVVAMTQKDAVKIPLDDSTQGWTFLRVEQEISAGLNAYEAALSSALEAS